MSGAPGPNPVRVGDPNFMPQNYLPDNYQKAIKYREALKWGLLATVYVVATAVFAAFTLACVTLAGFGIAAMTVDMGISAAIAILLGVGSAFYTYYFGLNAWDYCKRTHDTLNP